MRHTSQLQILTRSFQIGHLTLDNASVNEKMMEKLEEILDQRGIPFSAQDNRIR